MFRLSRHYFALFTFTFLLLLPAFESEARGGRRGGFGRSFSGGSRSSKPIFSGNERSRPTSRPDSRSSASSRADSDLSTRVNRGGTSQSRGEAMDGRESSSPASTGGAPGTRSSSSSNRPGFDGAGRTAGTTSIPRAMRLPNGREVPVTMDQSRGGYGFWDSAGKWILLSSILNSGQSHGYQPQYASTPPSTESNPPPQERAQAKSSGSGFLSIVGLLVLAFLIFGGISVFRAGRGARSRTSPATHLAAALGNKPPPMPAPGQKLTPLETWKRLEPGSFVTLSDQQAIEDSQKRGQGVHGIDYTVEQVGVATDFEGFATWVFAFLNDGHQKLLLMVKGNDQHIEHRVYFATEDFRPAKRENVLARGDRWLFDEPTGAMAPRVSHLQYTAEIPYRTGRHELRYVRKDHGERHCEYTEKPPMPGLPTLVATVVEYSTTEPTENPEMLVLEVATAKNKTGEVALYLGCPVRDSEVEIVKAAGAGAHYA